MNPKPIQKFQNRSTITITTPIQSIPTIQTLNCVFKHLLIMTTTIPIQLIHTTKILNISILKKYATTTTFIQSIHITL